MNTIKEINAALKTQCLECGDKNIYAKGLCRRCYGKMYYENNREKRKKYKVNIIKNDSLKILN